MGLLKVTKLNLSYRCYRHRSASSLASEESLTGDKAQRDLDLSDDKALVSDPPAFKAVFPPALFKTLLHKARTTTKLGVGTTTIVGTMGHKDLDEGVISESLEEKEEIPAPQLFLNVVKKQWAHLGAFPNPGENERRFYNMEQGFSQTLQLPSIDTPLVALASSSSLVTGDIADNLEEEDKIAELTLRKNFQSAAWAIKAAASASFFNRTTLLWLRQLQKRIPPQDVRLHQDLSKLLAATQFSADATLNAVKYGSKALSTSVVCRRLVWLRNWQADAKAKWKLAKSPFTGGFLFGESLGSVLDRNKDKRKVLPTATRQPDQHPLPYFRRPSFRAPDNDFQQQRYFQGRSDRQSDRSYPRDRPRFQPQSMQPFHGAGSHPFHQDKSLRSQSSHRWSPCTLCGSMGEHHFRLVGSQHSEIQTPAGVSLPSPEPFQNFFPSPGTR
ncbi:PREDICTED: bystin isoform X2 [Thamnophis sirtalis]|uniref:Bystin isoform X2 n=1 Tax=Thamnophis sirtalis TaxID=35019 RepID=A0A6I9X8P3_9SAUR|nr:PREDICTED: bystin isoform X2 [Thamnophis sirtalis]